MRKARIKRQAHHQTREKTILERVDRWLWATRFFKTRALAARAVTAGKIKVNGQRIKPARPVHPGDRLEIVREPLEYEVIVRGIPTRRGPAAEASKLYEETPESLERRETTQSQAKIVAASTPRPVKRPDKRSRRRIMGLQRGER